MVTDAARLSFAFSLSGAVHVAALSILTQNVIDPVPQHPTTLQVQIIQTTASLNISSKLGVARPATTPTHSESTAMKQREIPRSHWALPSAVTKALPVAAQGGPQALMEEDKPPSNKISAAATTGGETAESSGRLAHISKNDGEKILAAETIQSTPDKALSAPGVIFSTPPEYPEEARWEKRRGRTLLVFQLRSDGSVREIQLLNSSGHEDLDVAAMQALRKWRFQVPVSAEASVWYKYALRFDLL